MAFEDVLKIIPPESWLHDYMSCWPTSEPPKSYILLGGMMALGACYGRKVWFNEDVHTLYPMLNLLLIGPSGIGKTTALEYMAMPRVRGLPPEARPQLFIGKTTPQKLHEDLATGNPHAILYAEELAALFTKEKFMESMIPYVCLVPETPVLTSSLEWRPVGELNVGDTIVGFDENVKGKGKDRRFRKAAVVATGRQRLECVRILTDKGSVDVSLQHGFLVKKCGVDVWREAQQLRKGDELRWFGEPWEGQSLDNAYLSGLMDGEGSLSRYNIHFTQKEGLVLDKFRETLIRNGYSCLTYPKAAHRDCFDTRIDGGIYKRLRFIGTTRPVRLLPKAELLWDGLATSKGGRGIERANVLGIVSLGMQDTVPLETTTHTIIAGGFYTHNTKLLNYLEEMEERTKGGDLVRVLRPSVTVAGGSTAEWLQDQLPDTATSGGFLARFLICYEQYKGQRVAMPKHSMSRTKWQELMEYREGVFRRFLLLALAQGEMDFDGFEASDVYVEWYNNLKPVAGHLAPFAARGGEFVKRLAMLVALTCGRLRLQPQDVRAGIAIWEYCNAKLNEVVVPLTGTGKLLAQVLKIVGNQECTPQFICRQMRNYESTQGVMKLIQSHVLSGELAEVDGKLKRIYPKGA